MKTLKSTRGLSNCEQVDAYNIGFCIRCGAERECCEPVTPCDNCGCAASPIGLAGILPKPMKSPEQLEI